MTFPATIPTVLHTYTPTGVDALGVATLEPVSTQLDAYWLLSQSNEPPDATTDRYVERAELGVPSTWPQVTPQDRITVDGRVWEVDGYPVNYALGPFTSLWPGDGPATVIHLIRDVG